MLYYVIILLCFLAAVTTARKHVISTEHIIQRERKIWFCIIVMYMILLCGLRARVVGIDTYDYSQMYKEYVEYSLKEIIEYDLYDKGFVLLNWFLNKIHCNFVAASLVYAMLYICPIAIYIYKYSKNILMGLLVFVCMGLYTFAFSTIRQSIAMGLCICAYMSAQNIKGIKGFVCFSLMVWIASTIHASAIVFLPAYFLGKMPFNSIITMFMIVCAAIAMLFKNQMANIILDLATDTSDKYSVYAVSDGGTAGFKLYLFIVGIVLLRIIFFSKVRKDAKSDNLIYMMLFVLILFPAVQSGGAIMRIYFYYYIFIIVYLPNMLENIESPKDKLLMYTLITCVILYYYADVSLETKMLNPYYFFWQEVGL